MFEQAFKNIDDVLWKEAGCTTELDYTEQTSWLLFLKYLEGLEQDKAAEAAVEGKKHAFILDRTYRWDEWAAPKGKDGQIDRNKAQTGHDLRDFVNLKLFPYLKGFKAKASGPNTIEYKIGEIFGEIQNKITSGYNLREIIDHIDELRFRSITPQPAVASAGSMCWIRVSAYPPALDDGRLEIVDEDAKWGYQGESYDTLSRRRDHEHIFRHHQLPSGLPSLAASCKSVTTGGGDTKPSQ